jgi:poly(A) polymerase
MMLPSLAHETWLTDPTLRRIFGALAVGGGEARIAGGAIRNALLGEPVTDIDIATTLTPDRIIAAAKRARIAARPTGIEHGTVTLVSAGRAFEVTSLRVDVETFGRKARVVFTHDWEADARRRDFTMNALYCSLDGEIFDPTMGYRDILRKRVRFVGDPSKRISEDYLRILRFFRFHASYGAGTPNAKGLAACIAFKSRLKHLSGERIRQELFKLLEAKRASETLKLMAAKKLLKVLLPHATDLKAVERMAKIDKVHGLKPDALLRLGLIAKTPMTLRKRLCLTNAEMRRLEAIAEHVAPQPKLRERERRAVLYYLGQEGWHDTVRIAWARSKDTIESTAWSKLLRFAVEWPVPRFPVSGHDLLVRGFRPGPALGNELVRLEDWWIASDFTQGKEELLRKLQRQNG